MKYADFVCDLHGHTNRSDGSDSPAEFLRHAAERRMKIVAITDHDKILPEKIQVDAEEVNAEGYAASLGLRLLRGIEISTETYIDDVHLVCLGCDWSSVYFQKLEKMVTESKIESYKMLVQKLKRKGMDLSWEELLFNHGIPIGENDVQKKMIFNLMAEKGYVKDWSEAKLMVKNDTALSIPRIKPDAVEVIHEIHRQGGIVIMAHPYLVNDSVYFNESWISRERFIEHLIFEGLDGIEARYTYDKTSYGGTMTKEEIYWEVIQRYQGRIPVISGGSDYHGDRKRGVENPREIGECGLTESEFYQNRVLCSLLPEIKMEVCKR